MALNVLKPNPRPEKFIVASFPEVSCKNALDLINLYLSPFPQPSNLKAYNRMLINNFGDIVF